MPASKKNILICEDHQIVIDGLRSIFKNNDRYKVIDYVKNASDFWISYDKHDPDVLLLDLNLPGTNGLEILKQIRKENLAVKILILTMYNTESIIKEVARNGAHGFLLKNCSEYDLFEALEHIYKSDKFYLGEGVKSIQGTRIHEDADNFYKEIKITNREKEIIKELIQGLKVPQISKKLHISSYTVETHKKNIFRKLKIKSSFDLIKFVNENNLL